MHPEQLYQYMSIHRQQLEEFSRQQRLARELKAARRSARAAERASSPRWSRRPRRVVEQPSPTRA